VVEQLIEEVEDLWRLLRGEEAEIYTERDLKRTRAEQHVGGARMMVMVICHSKARNGSESKKQVPVDICSWMFVLNYSKQNEAAQTVAFA